jgi:hypothetical protein
MKSFSTTIETLLIYITHLTFQQYTASSVILELNKVGSCVEVVDLKQGNFAD